MMQQVTRFTSTINDKTSQWIVESDTPLEVAERMCLQFLQQLGMIKARQEAAQAEAIKNMPLPDNLPSNEDDIEEEKKESPEAS